MGSRVRQFRRQLGLASAFGLCVLLSGAVIGNGYSSDDVRLEPPDHEFRFARLVYNGSFMDGGFGGRGSSWATDAPEAEQHLLMGIRRLTRIDTFDPTKALAISRCTSNSVRRDDLIACPVLDE